MFSGMYFMGKLIQRCGRRDSYYDMSSMRDVLRIELYTDGQVKPFIWASDRHEKPTDVVPRAYRNHVNQQLLADLNEV